MCFNKKKKTLLNCPLILSACVGKRAIYFTHTHTHLHTSLISVWLHTSIQRENKLLRFLICFPLKRVRLITCFLLVCCLLVFLSIPFLLISAKEWNISCRKIVITDRNQSIYCYIYCKPHAVLHSVWIQLTIRITFNEHTKNGLISLYDKSKL